MTKLASYEEKEGKQNADIGNYFRGDYVAIQVVKSIVCATLTFILIFAMYIFYDFDTFMVEIYKIDLFSYLKNILIYYVITVVLYCVITYAFSTWKYFKARKSLKLFSQNLKKLGTICRERRN